MRTKKGLFSVAAGLIVCVAMVWYSGVIEGYEKTYEIRPEIRLPEHRSDAARAIDAYERLMERYMSLSENNFNGINVNFSTVTTKLDLIDSKLGSLSERIGRIEKALGIEPPKVAIPKAQVPKGHIPDGQVPKKLKSPGETAPLQSGQQAPQETGKVKGSGSYSL
jgi:hypothetical protein